jgi:uncharacterized protein YndB with AHSA1/START domain
MLRCIVLFGTFLAATAAAVHAEVADSSPASFAVKYVESIAAPPQEVWQSLVAIDRWWQGEHTYSGTAANLRIEPHAGGCFCETLPDGGSVLHMSVIFASPNQQLTLFGGLGPLQMSGATGAMTFQITKAGTGSRLALAYNVGGYFPGGLAALAPGVDSVLAEQFARLKRFIETGNPDEKMAPQTTPKPAQK